MSKITTKSSHITELDDDDIASITLTFFEDIVPKLARLNAKKGNINCDFAGKRYENWNIHFESIGSDFEIIEFEYDEESIGMDLDL